MRGDRRSFRRAVAASVVLHTALAGVIVLFGQWALNHRPSPVQPLLDTRSEGEPRVTMSFATVDVDVPPPPRTLPAEVLAPEPIAEVVDVPHAPIPLRAEAPAVEPAPAPIRQVAAFRPLLDGGTPVHGSLAPGQTIVYVLDASGSMGQSGRFDRARRALVATLRQQSAAVRCQVVVYAGSARVLLPSLGGCWPAIPENVERAATALMSLEPLGRSAHADALRLASRLNPEFILVFTDGDDLPAAAVRALAVGLARPPEVSVVVVGAERVGPPRLWPR